MMTPEPFHSLRVRILYLCFAIVVLCGCSPTVEPRQTQVLEVPIVADEGRSPEVMPRQSQDDWPGPIWDVLVAKQSLPHIASDGSTPEDIKRHYLERIRAGDKQAAVQALALVRSVITNEDGLFSSELAEVAQAALKTFPDGDFVMLLVRKLPNETIIYSGETPETEGARTLPLRKNIGTSLFPCGDSWKVIREVPELSSRCILQRLVDVSVKPGEAHLLLCMLENAPPTWEDAKDLLRLLVRFKGNEGVEGGVWNVLVKLYTSRFPPGVSPINVGPLYKAVKKASDGDIDEVWWNLNDALDRQLLNVGQQD